MSQFHSMSDDHNYMDEGFNALKTDVNSEIIHAISRRSNDSRIPRHPDYNYMDDGFNARLYKPALMVRWFMQSSQKKNGSCILRHRNG